MKKTLRKLFASFLAIAMVATLFAACGKSNSSNTLKMGFDPSFPPMGFRDNSGSFVGFDIDLANAVVEAMDGYDKLELVPIDWDSKDTELSSGNIDVIWNGFTMHTGTRDDDYTWTKPYMKNQQKIVVKADSSYKTSADLAGKVVAVQKDSSGLAAINDNPTFKASLGTLNQIGDYESALMELDAGSADAIVMDKVVIDYKISQGKTQFRVLDEAFAEEEYGIAFKKGNTELCDKVEAALTALAEKGKIKEISTKWFGSDITTFAK